MNSEAFRQALSLYPPQGIVFVGLGNPLRGDDGAGLIFVERLAASGWFGAAHHVLAGTNPENHLEPLVLRRPQLVVLIDAAWFDGPPGEIRWLKRTHVGPPRISTHAFSIGLVEDYLAFHLDLLVIRYLGIRPSSTRLGEGLSQPVRGALDRFFEVAPSQAAGERRWGDIGEKDPLLPSFPLDGGGGPLSSDSVSLTERNVREDIGGAQEDFDVRGKSISE